MQESRTSAVWYTLSGIAIGVGLGLLFAPKAGEELREDLADWSKRSGERSRSAFSKLSDMIPTRVKAAAGYGAVKEGVKEGGREVKKNLKESLNP